MVKSVLRCGTKYPTRQNRLHIGLVFIFGIFITIYAFPLRLQNQVKYLTHGVLFRSKIQLSHNVELKNRIALQTNISGLNDVDDIISLSKWAYENIDFSSADASVSRVTGLKEWMMDPGDLFDLFKSDQAGVFCGEHRISLE